jgi:hypothetical protein
MDPAEAWGGRRDCPAYCIIVVPKVMLSFYLLLLYIIISEPAGYLHNLLWLDMVITSSERTGQRLLVTVYGSIVSVALPPLW